MRTGKRGRGEPLSDSAAPRFHIIAEGKVDAQVLINVGCVVGDEETEHPIATEESDTSSICTDMYPERAE